MMTQMFLKVLWSFLLLDFATVQVSPVRHDTGKATLKISTKINTAGFRNLGEGPSPHTSLEIAPPPQRTHFQQ